MLEITIRRTSLVRVLTVIVFCLLLLHVGQLWVYYSIADPQVFDFVDLLDFDVEGNLPTLYSSLALLLAAALVGVAWKRSCYLKDSNSANWLVLCIIFVFLSLDEGAAIHEKIGIYVQSLHLFKAEGVLNFAWVVPYSLLTILFVVSYLKFLFRLPPGTRNGLILSGAVFILGALGIEMISARVAWLEGLVSLRYSILYTIEETFEMLGVILFISVMMRHLSNGSDSVRIVLSGR